jgi:hypothetical protein
VKVQLPFPAVATPEAAVQLWVNQSAIIKKAPGYSAAPAVHAAVTDCDAAAAALQTTVSDIDQLRVQLQGLEKTRSVQLGTPHIKHDAVSTACTVASNNDPQAAKLWTGQTAERVKPQTLPVGTAGPVDPKLNCIKSRSGSVKGSCLADPDAIGYLFQYGTDPNHPETWAPPTQMRGHTCTLRNMPLGQVLCMRIAVLRRGSVQGAWSIILQVTVR